MPQRGQGSSLTSARWRMRLNSRIRAPFVALLLNLGAGASASYGERHPFAHTEITGDGTMSPACSGRGGGALQQKLDALQILAHVLHVIAEQRGRSPDHPCGC